MIFARGVPFGTPRISCIPLYGGDAVYIKLAAELALAALSVFGLYALLRLLVTARFCAAKACWVLYVMADMTKERVAELLQTAEDEHFFYPDAPPLLLLQRGVDEDVVQMLEQHKVKFFVVEDL